MRHDTASGLHDSGPSPADQSRPPWVTAHVVIGFPIDVAAWHAGKYAWRGRSYLNSCAIGIEMVNLGKLQKIGEGVYKGAGGAGQENHGEGCWLAYINAQVRAFPICARCWRHPIEEILTHWLISPSRKVDINPLFPLEQVRSAVAIGAREIPARKKAHPQQLHLPGR